jgi:ABC-type transport system involved in multi-copper enzyme maturation permease subunit
VLLTIAAIGICVGVLAGKFSAGWLLWTSSTAVEMMITAMIALFFACVLRSATVATLCSLGYYTLARMMGVMIGIVEAKLDAGRPFFDFDGTVRTSCWQKSRRVST